MNGWIYQNTNIPGSNGLFCWFILDAYRHTDRQTLLKRDKRYANFDQLTVGWPMKFTSLSCPVDKIFGDSVTVTREAMSELSHKMWYILPVHLNRYYYLVYTIVFGKKYPWIWKKKYDQRVTNYSYLKILDATLHLYYRSCPSVGPTVRPLVPCYFRTRKNTISENTSKNQVKTKRYWYSETPL